MASPDAQCRPRASGADGESLGLQELQHCNSCVSVPSVCRTHDIGTSKSSRTGPASPRVLPSWRALQSLDYRKRTVNARSITFAVLDRLKPESKTAIDVRGVGAKYAVLRTETGKGAARPTAIIWPPPLRRSIIRSSAPIAFGERL